jgi:hypothetical protein
MEAKDRISELSTKFPGVSLWKETAWQIAPEILPPLSARQIDLTGCFTDKT